MKKFFKTVGVCLGFPILNFLIVSFIQVFFLGYTKNNISKKYFFTNNIRRYINFSINYNYTFTF